MTIKEATSHGLSILSRTSDSPRLDVQRLLLKVLDRHDPSLLVAHEEEILSATQTKTYQTQVNERATGKPLAYILGTWEFYGREFIVIPDVLIPRPDTEDLINQALPLIERLSSEKKRGLVIADIGTGSGCIAITLALESPFIEKILATDISPAALAVAKKNAAKYNVAEKIQFLLGDLLEPLEDKAIDLIVSNPPYVPTEELKKTPTTETVGLSFEPQIALDGGSDGLVFINKIKDFGVLAILETVGGKIIVVN